MQAKSEQGIPKAKGTVKREPNPENQAAQDAYLLKTPHFNKYPPEVKEEPLETSHIDRNRTEEPIEIEGAEEEEVKDIAEESENGETSEEEQGTKGTTTWQE